MIDKLFLEEVLSVASVGSDFAEVFVEDIESTSLSYMNGKVENALSGRESGVGIRVFDGVKTAYAIAPLEKMAIMEAAKNVSAALCANHARIDVSLKEVDYPKNGSIKIFPSSVSMQDKMSVVKECYLATKDEGAEIAQANVDYSDVCQRVTIANTEGLLCSDERVRTRISVQAVAANANESQTGRQSPGRSMGFELFDTIDVYEYARLAVRSAQTMLKAPFCPAGEMPVVLDNGFGGVIFHEACGHSLESTSVAKGNSVFSDMMGQKIASDCVSAVDDGTLDNEWGTTSCDDEGFKTDRNMLITNGVLTGYMVDRLGARRMKCNQTGSGRRQNYRFAPTSRMTNTYILPGQDNRNDMIASMGDGLYARQLGGGSVNPVTGQFNFAVLEGYLIKNGKIVNPVRGATLIGKGSEVLLNIDKVGRDLALGQGMCGSISGSVPTSVGQPPIRISRMIVGGRK